MKTKNKIVKIISSLLIISILVPTALFSQPKKAEALIPDFLNAALKAVHIFIAAPNTVANVANTAISVKTVAKEIARQVLMTIARRALAEITKSTVNWINTGHWGSPLFLENPESFFKDIAKFEVKTMVDLLGYNPIKYPFGKDFALNTINSYKSQLESNMQYSLSTVTADEVLLKGYQNDFNVGGWSGFLINTQYPQNNYIGFQMKATEELARNLQGTQQNSAQKIQTALQQGQGFLAPQVCMDEGTKYNTVGNQFKKPSFNEAEYRRKNPPPDCQGVPTPACQAEMEQWQSSLDQAKAEWAKTNTCKNLVSTTPGSVVASQAMNAISSTFRTTELGVAMGNSLSAIFDALLNKLIGSGLNALTSKSNPEPERDDWSYDGQTLGGAYGNNNPWDVGADEPIILKEFKILLDGKTIKTTSEGATIEEVGSVGGGEYIPGGITNTEKELRLIDDTIGLLGQIWPKSRELDICIPGPDLGWKTRTDKETQRNSAKLQEKANQDDPEKAAKAQLAYNELEYAVSFFKDWINNKMMLELPSAILFMDAVDEVNTLSQQSDEITKNKRIKSQALARLKAIKTALASITTQPVAGSGSAQEKVLVSLMKQYKATSADIATTVSIGDAENALAVAKEKLAKLVQLVGQCKKERTASGWTNPGGWSSRFTPTAQSTGSYTPASSTWSPTQTANGWWPALSPNGKYVAYGNWGESWVTNLETKQNYDFSKPSGLPAGGRCLAGQWIKSDTLSFVCEISTTQFYRYEVKVGEWVARKTNDDPTLVAGNITVAQDGHWASSMPNNRVVRDNKVLATGTGGTLSISGDTLVIACDNNHEEICVWKNNQKTNTHTTKTALHQMTIKNDYIAYGGYGPIHGIDPDGNDIDLSAVAGTKEFVPTLFDAGGDIWVASFSESIPGMATAVLLRPWGETASIAVNLGAVSMSIVFDDAKNEFIIAGNSDVGKLNVVRVDAATPRKIFTGGGSSGTNNTPGTERELFCDLPIKGGFSHESFVQKGAVTHPLIPLVNGKDVLNWPRWGGLFGTKRVNIELGCNTIYRANLLDYKGNIPGLTTVFETYEEMPPDTEEEQCIYTEESSYRDKLESAEEAVLNENSALADSLNTEENGRAFLALVETKLKSMGLNATDEVLNGHNNPSTGDIIAVWKEGDEMMERYDAISDSGAGSKTMRAAAYAGFAGFIPLSCTNSGGGKDCGCHTGKSISQCSTGIGNDSGAPSNISDVNWANGSDADIGSWNINSNLSSVNVGADSITLSHNKSGVWPAVDWALDPPTLIEGNAWILVWRNGKWQAATFDYLRPGQTTKDLSNIMGADGTLKGALGNFSPKAGELYGFVVSTPARSSARSINERSNIQTLTWPSGISCPE